MKPYKVDFSYYDKNYAIHREKEKIVEGKSIIDVAVFIRQSYNLIRIRSIKETEELQECILNEYPY